VKVAMLMLLNKGLMHGLINLISLMKMHITPTLNMSNLLDIKVIMLTILITIPIMVVHISTKLVMEQTCIINTIATTIIESITHNTHLLLIRLFN
jgi:hypothetical protein